MARKKKAAIDPGRYVDIQCSLTWECPKCGHTNYVESIPGQYDDLECNGCGRYSTFSGHSEGMYISRYED